jgi:hypothetical protein
MKRPILALAFGCLALVVGTVAGLATFWLTLGAAAAAGVGWLLGGTPGGGSVSVGYDGSGSDGGGGDGGGGGK